MENNNGKGIFYGVIGVATLVVAIIGATFAYFAASTTGEKNAVAANSASVSGKLAITQDDKYNAPDLIPTAGDTMVLSYKQSKDGVGNKKQCRGASQADANADYGLCSYYNFTITNSADVATTVYLSLKTETNTFGINDETKTGKNQFLKYCVYKKVDTAYNTDTPEKVCGLVPEGTSEQQFASVNLPATGGTASYSVVLYLENDNSDQSSLYSGKAYTGTVYASTSTGGKNIVGVIAGQQDAGQ